jgi:acyl-CoA reductase-like NAD-dependent aldehyde dehydrogenase
MFVEGNVCLIKMNPVNEYLGPFYEEAFRPLFDRGYLRVAYGGGDVGAYLSQHAMVDDIHITGSDRTHDLIVWGPPGPERTRRMESNEPLLKKTISSELGCVTPVVIVPGNFSPRELQFVAENVATMVVNNGSFNCNAAKMLVTSKHWPQREDFLGRVRGILSTAALRRAYYPGARDRYETLLKDRANVVKLGSPADDQLAWALVFGLEAGAGNEPLFTTEPFCGILSEVALDEREAAPFLDAATEFCNEKLWGTLSCSVIIHPETEKDPVVAGALDSAVARLRYGGVAINHWAGTIYGTVTPPWGGHPSSTLKDIQGGLGWVHNTYMLEGIEKSVMRGPLTMAPKPPWFITHKRSHEVGRRMVDFEASPSWLKLPGIVVQALRG